MSTSSRLIIAIFGLSLTITASCTGQVSTYPDMSGDTTVYDGGAGDTGSGDTSSGDTGSGDISSGDTGSGGGTIANDVVLVKAGTFTMGSPKGEPGRENDEAQHEVTLTRSFYLQSTEVTQGQWAALMKNNPSFFKSCGDDCPVESVTWWEAVAYANALSVQKGLPECYTLKGCSKVSPGKGMVCGSVSVNAAGGDPYQCSGYRLPTEAEWEYAYRAGTTTAYYASNVDAIAWFDSNSGNKTHPVGKKTSNAWGLYDMAGNVVEWCWDWNGVYPSKGITDPTGPGTGTGRVGRGGSWLSDADNLRAAHRSHSNPDGHNYYLGFRLARSAP